MSRGLKWAKEHPHKAREHQEKYEAKPSTKYLRYKKDATARGHKFRLTLEQFKKFWKKPCDYCGFKIFTIGLDRVSPNQGYKLSNVVSCCKRCNFAKGNLTRADFLEMCLAVSTQFYMRIESRGRA